MDRADSTPAGEKSSVDSNNDLSLVKLTEFKSTAQTTLNRLLPDHGEHLDRAELAKLIADPSLKGADAITVAALYEVSVHPLGHSDNETPQPWAITSLADIAAVPVSPADNEALKEKFLKTNSPNGRARIMAEGDLENGAVFYRRDEQRTPGCCEHCAAGKPGNNWP
jgi:hypothetical protein